MRESVIDLLRLKKPIVWIKTLEEKRVIKDILDISREYSFLINNIYEWSIVSKLHKIENNNELIEVSKTISIDSISSLINERRIEVKEQGYKNTDVFIIKDAHMITDKPPIIRTIRNIYDTINNITDKYYCPIIMISPFNDIPEELNHLVDIVDYSTPDKKHIYNSLIKMFFNNYSQEENSKELFDKAVDLMHGLTEMDIDNILKKSFSLYNRINLDIIKEYKIKELKKTGLLDYKITNTSIDNVAGNDNFKDWLKNISLCMSKEAKEFGLESPKGYLALGLPGTSKSYMAEAVASYIDIPFISLDMSKIMHRHVGQSERNMSEALRLIESCAPCVLLIDEVEKSLSGMQSQGKSDGGTFARAFSSLLQFLNKDNNVFTIMTSNDVTQLPPELTRAGRLDAIWYFGLPSEKERIDIFNIHLLKRNQIIDKHDVMEAAILTEGYTGAEIEQIVKYSHMKAFNNKLNNNGTGIITINELKESIDFVVPISKHSKEKIKALEAWSEGRVLYANKKEEIKKEHIEWDFQL